jgi:MinD superfamily P-loop ATPase
MRIAVASGKGGTGKTTVAVNLACSAEGPVQLLDCDVEEPNAHIFLRPEIRRKVRVGVPVPAVDADRCTGCGECGRICRYHAIVSLKTGCLVFEELCHGCGGCARVCPEGAIREIERDIGAVEIGSRGPVEFVGGRLNVGQAMSPPLIRAVKQYAADREDSGAMVVVDCPPGTSCPVITAVRDCDCAVLVTEPTPFGLHDLKLAVETLRRIQVPFGVVINRADAGDARVTEYCGSEGIPVLLEIPDDRRIAEAYSRGYVIVDALPEYRQRFARLAARLRETGAERLEGFQGRVDDAHL